MATYSYFNDIANDLNHPINLYYSLLIPWQREGIALKLPATLPESSIGGIGDGHIKSLKLNVQLPSNTTSSNSKLGAMLYAQLGVGAATGIASAFLENPQYSPDAGNGFGLVDNFIADGAKTKGGTALVNTGASLMNTGLSSGNFGLALAGGIAGTLGTVWNAGWGTKTNEAAKASNEGAVLTLNSTLGYAGNWDNIKGPQSVANYLKVYSNGWFTNSANSKNAAEKAKYDLAVGFADRLLLNLVTSLQGEESNAMAANYASTGGLLEESKSLFNAPNRLISNTISRKDLYRLKTSTSSKGKIITKKTKAEEREVNPLYFNTILANGGKVEIIEDDRPKLDDTYEFKNEEEMKSFLKKHNLTEDNYIIE